MDVQAATTASAAPQQTGPLSSAPLAPPGDAQAKTAAVPGTHDDSSKPLADTVAKVLGAHAPGQSAVTVSYRVEHDPNMIVTVFTDPNTGQEIAQVPAEVMIQMAQFFDKQTGVAVDRSA
jgi:uncharacterized FlaG/YvyC family protein